MGEVMAVPEAEKKFKGSEGRKG